MKKINVKRMFVGFIAVMCLLSIFGIVGGIEWGESPLLALWSIPAFGIFVFNCYILGLFD